MRSAADAPAITIAAAGARIRGTRGTAGNDAADAARGRRSGQSPSGGWRRSGRRAWPASRLMAEDESGALAVGITKGMDGTPIVDWGSTEGLGLYVTSPSAELPAGAGQTVKNGET